MSVMITYSNKFVDILNLESSDPFCIEDIAHSLAMKCRFNGHCSDFYSVAEHSVYCAMLAPDELKLPALFHDAAESFMGDITAPIKKKYKSIFKPIEEAIDARIRETFNLPDLTLKEYDIIKTIDDQLLNYEASLLFEDMYSDKRFIWPDKNLPKPDVELLILPPSYAKSLFLSTYYKLRKETK